MKKNCVVLDVDRTVINHTSWFKACTCSGLLIPHQKINLFKQYDKDFYQIGRRNEFEKETFNLIEPIVSKRFVELVKKVNPNTNIKVGDYFSEDALFMAGEYTAQFLVDIEKYCYKVLKTLSDIYRNDIEIVYLTSGYEPFMNGVIHNIHQRMNCKLNYKLIGSEVSVIDGRIVLGKRHINQKDKIYYIDKIIKDGDNIVLFADDSMEDARLFTAVENQKGLALHITYDRNNISNWESIYKEYFYETGIKKYLMNYSPIRVQNEPVVSVNWTFFSERTDKIGIFNLSVTEYEKIKDFLQSNNLCELYSDLNGFSYKKDQVIYFRNLIYYYWLPPYLNPKTIDNYASWNILFSKCCKAFKDLIEADCDNEYVFLVLFYVFTDNFLYALYLADYSFSIENARKDNLEKCIILLNSFLIDLFDNKLKKSDLGPLYEIITEIEKIDYSSVGRLNKFLIELDNTIQSYKTAYYVYDKICNSHESVKSIICFTLGGIEVGYAVKSLLDKKYKKKIPLFLCNYSSKNRVNHKSALDFTNEYISAADLEELKKLEDVPGSILLCDNNVTTFKTLINAKSYFDSLGFDTKCCVVNVNYDNIVDWLLEKDRCENVAESYLSTLDFSPVGEYVTSYNTWGTSDKSRIIEDIYKHDLEEPVISMDIAEKKFNLLKLCRVHNIFDLNIAIKLGASMIGIHVVYNDKKSYFKNEIPCLHNKKYRKLPIPAYEIDSIRRMSTVISDNILPIFVFERKISKKNIIKSIELLGFSKLEKVGIQCQYRINEKTLRNYISMGFSSICCTIGLQQADFIEYFETCSRVLRPENDFILIDCSKHQPDFISEGKEKIISSIEEKELLLRKQLEKITNNRIRIIIADDVTYSKINKLYQAIAGAGKNVVGIDMQNIIEVDKNEQKFALVKHNNLSYYAKISKSPNMLKKWNSN